MFEVAKTEVLVIEGLVWPSRPNQVNEIFKSYVLGITRT